MAKTKLTLTAPEIAVLQRPLNGQGGLQSFGNQLQTLLDPQSGEIELSDAQLGRIIRHMKYGPGGFEGRLRDAFGRSIALALHQA